MIIYTAPVFQGDRASTLASALRWEGGNSGSTTDVTRYKRDFYIYGPRATHIVGVLLCAIGGRHIELVAPQ